MPYENLPHDHGGDVAHIMEHMPTDAALQTVADVFKLMADTSRIRIFWLLCHWLIVSRRVGKEVYYKASDKPQARLLHHVIEELVEITCPDCAEAHTHGAKKLDK